MANEKKGFILYGDLIYTVEKMTDSDAGELLKHILNYVNDENPVTENMVVDLVFEPIKQQLKRDLTRWEKTREGRSKAGKISAAKRKQQKATNSTSVESVQQTSTNPTVNDTVTVTVNDTVNVNVKDINKSIVPKIQKEFSESILNTYDEILNFFPEHLRPKDNKQKNNWLDTIEKLNRIEKLPLDYIILITKSARQDEFWSKTFLSLSKLRKKNKEGVMYVLVFNEQFNKKTKQDRELEVIKANSTGWFKENQ